MCSMHHRGHYSMIAYKLPFLLLISSMTLMLISSYSRERFVLFNSSLVDKNLPHFSFYIDNAHYEWMIQQEKGVMAVAAKAMFMKAPHCISIDVGMNDGFYTQLSAAFGCKVYSFEIQPRCIDLVRRVTEKNGFNDRVMIIKQPVTSKHNAIVNIPHGSNSKLHESVCDGGFSFTGSNPEKLAHIQYNITGYRSMYSVALQNFLPLNTIVNFMKVDVEGHEVHVFEGAEQLFKEKRVLFAVAEIFPNRWDVSQGDYFKQAGIFKRIMSYGYLIRCAKDPISPVQYSQALESEFEVALFRRDCNDWEIYLPTATVSLGAN